MKVLIVYGTTEGQTRKIANFLKDDAEKAGHQVAIFDSTANPPSPAGYDVVLIGCSVHVAKYHNAIITYAKDNAGALNKMTSGFFSVSLAAAGHDEESLKEMHTIADNFLKYTGWKPVDIEHIAGALLYTKYDFFKRFIMRMIAKRKGDDTNTSEDYEYTDWSKVKAFLNRMLKGG
jgi:menaquinone-dependent protoporphyrinogen oxidase